VIIERNVKSVLTIAGSDPTGGAGFQADLKVFRSFGLHGLSLPTVLTAQDTRGVGAICPLERVFFQEQLELLLQDMDPEAAKAGMLYSPWVVELVAAEIRKGRIRNMVVDPVTVSSSGRSLVAEGTPDLVRRLLFPLARVVTPNISEASLYTGVAIKDEGGMQEAAAVLKEMGPEVVVITGGHLEGRAVDVYYDGKRFHSMESAKVSGEFHGTGCAFSSAVAAALALGDDPLQAARRAKTFVSDAILRSYRLGRGMRLLSL
jgi:hydroxymethylpyrimidine/phosphomethylpyrimidine kinase